MDTYEVEFDNILEDMPSEEQSGCFDLDFVRDCHCKVNEAAVLHFVDNLFIFDSNPFLKDIRIPTLIISGKFDIAFPTNQVRLLHEGIPGSRFFEFIHSGHMPFLTEFDLFHQRLSSFLDDI